MKIYISENRQESFCACFCAGIECMYFKEYNRADRTGKADLWCSTDTEVRRNGSCDGIPVRRNRRRKPVCGQWILAGYEYGERENAGDTPIRTPYYLAGDEGEESKIHIYSEGDQLYADYYHCQNEGTTTINGMAFEEETTTTEDQPAARLKTEWMNRKYAVQ